jgi:hypothetical protein
MLTTHAGEIRVNNQDEIQCESPADMAASLLKAADEIELMADVLATEVESWGEDYAASLRRSAYALTAMR